MQCASSVASSPPPDPTLLPSPSTPTPHTPPHPHTPFTVPSPTLPLPRCGLSASGPYELVDAQFNPLVVATRTAAETAGLFRKLMTALTSVQDEVIDTSRAIALASGTVNATVATSLVHAHTFTEGFRDFMRAYRSAVGLAVPLSDLLRSAVDMEQLQRRVETVADISTVAAMATSTAVALQWLEERPSPAFRCVDLPVECADMPRFVEETEDSYAALVDDMALGEHRLPTTILAGLGQTICSMRKGLDLARQSLTLAMPTLEMNINMLLQGPAALTGDGPQCKTGDKYCLAKIERSDDWYRKLVFPALFMQFWDLGAPALGLDYCGTRMNRRFTIPGLWSHYALQGSGFLQHASTWMPVICELYAHLLAYVPLVPNSCSREGTSFFATLDSFGAIAKVSTVQPVHYSHSFTAPLTHPPHTTLR